MALNIFAWIVFVTMIASLLAVLAFLGNWPGKVARDRKHPYVDAITIGSWVALLSGGVLWPLILIWSYATPVLEQSGESPPRRASPAVDAGRRC